MNIKWIKHKNILSNIWLKFHQPFIHSFVQSRITNKNENKNKNILTRTITKTASNYKSSFEIKLKQFAFIKLFHFHIIIKIEMNTHTYIH